MSIILNSILIVQLWDSLFEISTQTTNPFCFKNLSEVMRLHFCFTWFRWYSFRLLLLAAICIYGCRRFFEKKKSESSKKLLNFVVDRMKIETFILSIMYRHKVSNEHMIRMYFIIYYLISDLHSYLRFPFFYLRFLSQILSNLWKQLTVNKINVEKKN